jgi:hypothetical protein
MPEAVPDLSRSFNSDELKEMSKEVKETTKERVAIG